MSFQAKQHFPSPFLQPSSNALAQSLAILHLRRDQLVPISLSHFDEAEKGYDEGKVVNTRFGSFPHSTLIGLPWGAQVRASKVDTGSRGRKSAGKKRKHEEIERDDGPSTPLQMASTPKAAVAAATGFAHILAPTPEAWAMSLPHRTQIVYTPDYSFILQRLKARPGVQIIEAGAGSGSFSHAASRAVYRGYPSHVNQTTGKVWSYEFHKQRVETLEKEIDDHGLRGIVQVTHRDVYKDGFGVLSQEGEQLVQATAVFLDLPAPWLALPHLSRSLKHQTFTGKFETKSSDTQEGVVKGPLNENSPIHLCCFLPCIEQVQRAVSALQSHSWQHVSVVEVTAQRLEVRRERVGINEEGLKGVNPSPASVEEAILKLKEDENRTQVFHDISQRLARGEERVAIDRNGVRTKHERLRDIQKASTHRKLYREGRLVHRSEPEMKNHTSYLIFAVLPRVWGEDDEERIRREL